MIKFYCAVCELSEAEQGKGECRLQLDQRKEFYGNSGKCLTPPPKISWIWGANALLFREGIFINPLRESGIMVQRKHSILSNLNCRNSWDYRTMHCSKLFITELLFHPMWAVNIGLEMSWKLWSAEENSPRGNEPSQENLWYLENKYTKALILHLNGLSPLFFWTDACRRFRNSGETGSFNPDIKFSHDCPSLT